MFIVKGAQGASRYLDPHSKAFDQVKRILDSTSPLKYKGSTYRGALIVKQIFAIDADINHYAIW
jgi:hypothetical protein